jgi:hypothetical protein
LGLDADNARRFFLDINPPINYGERRTSYFSAIGNFLLDRVKDMAGDIIEEYTGIPVNDIRDHMSLEV